MPCNVVCACKIMVYAFVVLCLLINVIDSSKGYSAKQEKQCQSIDQYGKSVLGKCLPFLLCPRLLEFAKRPGKTVEDFKLLKTLTCGFDKNEPWICCPERDIYHPPDPDDENSRLPLEFPDDDLKKHRGTLNINPDRKGSPDVPFSLGNGKFNLIPKLEDCGEPRQDVSTSTRIIGGLKAEPGEFPYVAILYRIDTVTDEEEYYCSGSILNQFYILTAAHCILTNQDSTHKLAYVQVGVTDVNERCHKSNQRECLNERRYEVKETVVHPKYVYGSRDRNHDIALIRTTEPMELNENFVRPVCLPIARAYGLSETSMLGEKTQEELQRRKSTVIGHGIVAGWGRSSNIGSQSSTTLKHTVIPILSRNECQDRYGNQVKISEKQICAGGEIGPCVGDSGGPLLIPFEPEKNNERQKSFSGKMFQTGIVSFGPALCGGSSGKPTVFTSVLPYIEWILDSMYL